MDLARIHNFFKIYLYRTINLYQSLEASKWDAAFGRLRVPFPPLDRKRERAAANLCAGVRGGSSAGLLADSARWRTYFDNFLYKMQICRYFFDDYNRQLEV